jgi:hypothetical protein
MAMNQDECLQALKTSLQTLTQTIALLVQQNLDREAMNVLPSTSNPASEGSNFIDLLEHHVKPTSQLCNTQHLKPATPTDFTGD